MPRRKKLPELSETPDLSGLGRPDKDPHDWIIQKSNPLRTLSQSELSLTHFKILDAYLARIDSRKPEKRYVQFQKGELEQLLGVVKINRDDLNARLDGLFCAITIQDDNKPDRFVKIGLFAKAECKQDKDGLWKVKLACTQEAMEYIFNIENIGYIRYRLRNIINLKSRYSYILYLFLTEIRNSNRPNTFSISVDDLKELLNCKAESYSEFKLFNNRILKNCCEEINEKTDIKYSYTPDKPKYGRRITSVTFSIEKVHNRLPSDDPNQLGFDNVSQQQYPEHLELLADACDNAFSADEMQVIFDIIVTLDIPQLTGGIDISRYHYLKQKYSELLLQLKKTKINNKFLYFKAMLK